MSQSLTVPQLSVVRPTAYATERPVTESAVTGAAFVTVRPGVSSAPAVPADRERAEGREGDGEGERSHCPHHARATVKAA